MEESKPQNQEISFTIDGEQYNSLRDIDNTIKLRSLALANLELEKRKLLNHIDSLHQARNSIVSKFIKEKGVDETKVINASLTPDSPTSARLDLTVSAS